MPLNKLPNFIPGYYQFGYPESIQFNSPLDSALWFTYILLEAVVTKVGSVAGPIWRCAGDWEPGISPVSGSPPTTAFFLTRRDRCRSTV